MSFSGSIFLEMLDDGTNWRVLAEVVYTDSAGRKWTVPQGMITDLASIPRIVWTLVGSPGTGLYRKAAVFHDAAYRVPGMVKDDADRMLRECAIECGCDVELADAIYEGVHLAGGSSFQGDQNAQGNQG